MSLHVLRGDGRGGLALSTDMDLDGRLNAMAVGDVNRADGVPDVVVSIAEPTGPAPPFAYVGMMESEDAKPVVYLSRGERLLAVSEGDVIDQVYRIQSLSTHRIVLVYLPLGKEQALAIGSERP